MGFRYGIVILLVVLASPMAFGWAYKNNVKRNTVVVGGSNETWHFGFNYTNWAFQNHPFYLHDTLVFKYDPPSNTTFPHSVYLFRDFWSFLSCDLRRAKRIANVTQGGGEGFKFVMNQWRPYFFACGERGGFHCKVGLMKFALMPLPRYNFGG